MTEFNSQNSSDLFIEKVKTTKEGMCGIYRPATIHITAGTYIHALNTDEIKL